MGRSRCFLLYRHGPRVRAADASPLLRSEGYPSRLRRAGREYRLASDGDIPWFWDELRDERGRTVGFTFPVPGADPLLAPLLADAENVIPVGGDAWVMLGDCEGPWWERVQGFSCAVYHGEPAPPDCLLLMSDFSGNPVAFELAPLPDGVENADPETPERLPWPRGAFWDLLLRRPGGGTGRV